MSLTIPPGFGLAAFEVISVQGTSPFVTTIGVDLGDVGGDFQGAAGFLFEQYEAAFISLMSTAFTLNRVVLTVGEDGPGGSVISGNTPVTGTRTGTFGSVVQAVLVNKVTNVLGRQGRGRMFLPGMLSQTEVNTSGIISSASVTSFQAGVTSFLTGLNEPEPGYPGPCPPVLLHSNNVLAPTPIVGLVVTNKTGIIRKRIR